MMTVMVGVDGDDVTGDEINEYNNDDENNYDGR